MNLGDNNNYISLQGKFLVGLAVIFICFCLLVTFLLYAYEKKKLRQEVLQKTELIMAAADANRSYVRDILRPRMYEEFGEEVFIMEAMSSSYISRVVMDRFQQEFPAFIYRRVAMDARNPDFEANPAEVEKIAWFNNNPEETEWHGLVKDGDKNLYMRYKPIRFAISCLHCHGNPEDAPLAVKEKYGAEKGFHRSLDDVWGVVSVGMEVKLGMVQVMEVAWKVFGITFAAAFFLYGIIWFFFNRLVIADLRNLLEIFRNNLKDEHGVRLYEQARNKDEMRELSSAVQMVARHVQKTGARLEDYAKNLEQKVSERTDELQRSEKKLRQQVTSRNRELKILNTISELTTSSFRLEEILPSILRQAIKAASVSGGGIYLLDRKQGKLVLQCSCGTDALPDVIPFEPEACLLHLKENRLDFESFLEEAACHYFSGSNNETWLQDTFNIPICCRGQVLGVISFRKRNSLELDLQKQELLFSIGHQAGIAIESLGNIANLIQGRELLQSVFDGITDMLVLLDEDKKVKMVNKAFLSLHNLHLTDIINKKIDSLQTSIPCPLQQSSILSSSIPQQLTTENVSLDNGLIYEVSFYPVYSDDGKLVNLVCSARDITEKKEIARKIKQAEKLVSLGQLAAGVAHEINNPLGIILCYTDIICADNKNLPEQVKDDVKIIEKHARSCQRIVADLLDFGRRQKLNIKNGSLNETVAEVVDIMQPRFEKNSIEVKFHPEKEEPPLFFDQDKMQQVMLNLLMNSNHAVGNGGKIEVSLFFDKSASVMKIVVWDNGKGIDKEVIDKIFEPFFSTKEPGDGTGLGLSVSYGFVRDHGGDILVESEPAKFSKFTIILPVKRTEETG